ncbi:type II secretion system protein N [Massilia rhizosphaerae]|uniref:type II secretion system protein N n=1 Tax=Massilia rhizosphaerae TaxID=2784389 RepID=UPI0018DBA4F5|nr:type II secretion system protein N [Massilia rhizosphaerae]
MNKRLPLLLSLLGVILLAASLAYWILQLYQPPQRPLAAVPQTGQPDPAIDAAATLFGGQPVASAANYQLTGVVADGNSSVAIIVAEGSPPKALKVGKELAPGVTLAEVHPHYVMLSDGGVMKRVDLATDTKPAAPMNGPGAAPPGAQQPNAQPNFPQPQPITVAPAVQPTQVNEAAVPEPPMAPGAVQPQPQPSMTNPGDVGAHDNPPPANPNPINGTPNQVPMPPQTRGTENPAGQPNTQ